MTVMSVLQRERSRVGKATISALAAGRADRVVVLLHGIPTSAHLWADVLESLADRGLRVLAPDLPGYGTTRPGPGDDWSLAGAAELVADWLRWLDVSDAWIVGHDAGGAVAQILAVEHADVVARLTLVNSIVDGSWPAPRARFATLAAKLGLYRPAAALGMVPNAFIRWQLGRGFADRDRMARVDEEAVFWDGKWSDPAGRRAFQAHLAALDSRDTARVVGRLGRLEIPCQLIWGTADVFQRWEVAGHRLRDLLPDPSVTKLGDCGHFVPLECSRGLEEAMVAWEDEGAT